MRSPIAGHRALRWGLGIALACSLVPAATLAQPLLSEAIAGATARSADTEQPTQTAVPGQALVLYHASDRASVDTLDSSNADELAGAGFGVVQEWDFSAVDRALEEGAIEPQTAEGTTGDVPEGSDLRVALVERDGADADDLAAELEALDFVVAAQPNYILSVDTSAPSSPRPRSERSSSRASRLLRSLPSRMTARST